MPKLLFIGDVVGRPGRDAIVERLPKLREELQADFVVANGENAAAGAGLTAALANDLLAAGVDAITLGDHLWDQRGFDAELPALDRVCRPSNLPKQCPGRTHLIVERNGIRLGIFTVLGGAFMKLPADNPFHNGDAMMEQLKGQCDAILAEIHAEATSEKIAYGWYMDGRATLVAGTHTHVPTADEIVLPRGTAYITDVGMTGPYQSVLGREVQGVLGRFLDSMPRKWEIATGDVRICGCLVEFTKRGMATSIQRVDIRL